MDERKPPQLETGSKPGRETDRGDRLSLVMLTIVAVGGAVTGNLSRLFGFEPWMILPGAATSFVTAILLWWTDAFRYRP
jgi:hypothetical protein